MSTADKISFDGVAPPLKAKQPRFLFGALYALILASTLLALVTDKVIILGLPVLALGIYFFATNYRALYMLMWVAIPLSTEIEIGSLGMDFPDEILMLLCSGVVVILLLARQVEFQIKRFLHPVSLLILAHLGWLIVTALDSEAPVISWKFVAAKIWYVLAFFTLTTILFDPLRDPAKWMKLIVVPTVMTIVIIWIRHYGSQFSFATVNEVLKPFYRNHVDYALMLGALFPFVWIYRNTWGSRLVGLAVSMIFLIAIYFAYTRAAYLGLIIAAVSIAIMHFRLMKYALVLSLIIAVAGVSILARNNKYIDYAPQYDKTITHLKFDELIEATYQMEDISTMERVYRWVAGFYMYSEKPVFGFGPGAFYNYYKSYTDENFVTYVSDNPDRSGMHNYYLMTLVEQGIPGLVFFLALCFVALMKAEWLYHRITDKEARKLLVAVTACLVFICSICLLNDMIETDKVGSFFFFSLAILVLLERFAPEQAGGNSDLQSSGSRQTP